MNGDVEVEVPLSMIPIEAFFLVSGLGFSTIMTAPLSKIIASRISQAIQAAGFTSQDQFAQHAGIWRGTLSKILTGSVDIRTSTLERIAEALGIPPHTLLIPDSADPDLTKTPSSLKGPWRRVDSEITVKIRIPEGVDPPQWLKDVCKHGERQSPPQRSAVTRPKKPLSAKKP